MYDAPEDDRNGIHGAILEICELEVYGNKIFKFLLTITQEKSQTKHLTCSFYDIDTFKSKNKFHKFWWLCTC